MTIEELQSRLKALDKERDCVLEKINELQMQPSQISAAVYKRVSSISPEDRITLFRNLFKGRDDVYPKLWISKKTGAKGYSPVCKKEWTPGICRKPMVKCSACENRQFAPLTDDVIRLHLNGRIVAGVYPLLEDETCYFLAVDFDKQSWKDDARAFMSTCRNNDIPAYLERSRSGNGGHVWIFFAGPVAAALARQMGSYLLTETMEKRHELDMKSYDRLFPNQDTMPKGGFGNLIALPFQKAAAEIGNSIFIDENLEAYEDQWSFLKSMEKISQHRVQQFVDEILRTKDLMGIRTSQTDDEGQPWEGQANSRRIFSRLTCPLPEKISEAMQTGFIFVEKGCLLN